jgi:hypothetical protein
MLFLFLLELMVKRNYDFKQIIVLIAIFVELRDVVTVLSPHLLPFYDGVSDLKLKLHHTY